METICRPAVKCNHSDVIRGSLAEWSKALVLGTSPKGRGFESLSCQNVSFSLIEGGEKWFLLQVRLELTTPAYL